MRVGLALLAGGLAVVAGLVSGCGGGGGGRTGAPTTYSVRQLSTSSGEAVSINDSGQAVGVTGLGSVIWYPDGSSKTVSENADPFNMPVEPVDINSSAQIVGTYLDDGLYFWDAGSTAPYPLPVSPDYQPVRPTAMNDVPVVIGTARGPASGYSAFTYGYPGVFRILEFPTGGAWQDIIAEDINNAGQIVGAAYLSYQVYSHINIGSRAVVWDSQSRVRTLPEPTGATASSALAVNEGGQIAGAWMDGKSVVHAVVWNSDGSTRTLSSPSGYANCIATDINRTGQVVGYAWNGADMISAERAVSWDADGAAALLAGLADNAGCCANAINNSGQIVGKSQADAGSAYDWGFPVIWEMR